MSSVVCRSVKSRSDDTLLTAGGAIAQPAVQHGINSIKSRRDDTIKRKVSLLRDLRGQRILLVSVVRSP
ncbi:MAG: hypothetical protein FWF53_08275 [Candidatus Azobacteroides sp.]|nr:hypothetical protein [Candidatus Azobacteroides sp.]